MSILKVTALVIVRARRVLLVKHGDDFWKFPGGVVEDSDINLSRRPEGRPGKNCIPNSSSFSASHFSGV